MDDQIIISHNQINKLKNIIETTPKKSGIYKMINIDEVIIYIGKAKNINKRLKSYLLPTKEIRKIKMLSQIKSIDTIITNSESEALILEAKLIRDLQPKYNILMRDDKTYSVIAIDMNHKFPRIYKARQSDQKKTKIKKFGPLTSGKDAKANISIIQQIFKIRSCSNSFFSSRTRPCMEYQINRCTGPCAKLISEEEYKKTIQEAIKALSGEIGWIIEKLEKKMKLNSKNLEYEAAAKIRDDIKSLKKMEERNAFPTEKQGDYIGICCNEEEFCIYVLCIRGKQIAGSPKFFTPLSEGQKLEDVLEAFINQYYLNIAFDIPNEIYIAYKIPDKETIEKAILNHRKQKIEIKIAKSQNVKKVIEISQENARSSLEERLLKKLNTENAYSTMEKMFKIQKINSIEVYDNSHTSGFAQIGGCIRATKQGFERHKYKKFNMNHIRKSDDYAMISETLKKRFEEKSDIPDLIIIDGGKGQLTAAKKTLTKIGLNNVCCIAFAKGKERRSRNETIYITNLNSIKLESSNSTMRYIQHIRDEAHNFVINQHKKERSRQSLGSAHLSCNWSNFNKQK